MARARVVVIGAGLGGLTVDEELDQPSDHQVAHDQPIAADLDDQAILRRVTITISAPTTTMLNANPVVQWIAMPDGGSISGGVVTALLSVGSLHAPLTDTLLTSPSYVATHRYVPAAVGMNDA